MGLTAHGIKYPEMPDIPNVPDDIGGIAKLNQSTQAWFATLDTVNVGKIAAMDARCAATEASVSTANASITPAVSRQTAQQVSVNAISARNDSVKGRLDARDTALAAEQSVVQGYTGQLASLNIQKGRGIVGVNTNITSQTIGANSDWNAFGSVTFNDPAPNSSRIYRLSMQMTVQDTSGQSGLNWYTTIGFAWGQGTSYDGSASFSVLQLLDNYYQQIMPVYVETIITNVTWPQWTVFGVALANGTVDYSVGSSGIDTGYILIEDIGLQL